MLEARPEGREDRGRVGREAERSAKDGVTAAAKKLADKDNYAWKRSCKIPLFHTPGLDPHSRSIHTPTTMINITPQQLRKAANVQEKIQSLQKKLGQLLGGPGETSAIEAPKKRKMSAAGIARIRAAAKARWAKIKAAKAPKKRKLSAQGIANIRAGVRRRMAAKGQAVPKPKRKISPAARARLSALAKARWTEAKKAGKSRL